MGPSGCGKSTRSCNLVAGLDAPSEGRNRSIRCRSRTNPSVGPAAKRPAAALGHAVNVEFGLEARSISAADRRARRAAGVAALPAAGFADGYPYLSGGMRQRAALARGVAIESAIVLLDEPFSALDAQTELRFCRRASRDDRVVIIKHLLITHSDRSGEHVGSHMVMASAPADRRREEITIDLPDRDIRWRESRRDAREICRDVACQPASCGEGGRQVRPDRCQRAP